MKKILGLLAIAAIMVGMLAGPAAAATVDAGVLTGTATVGKTGPCGEDGGLGLPDPLNTKQAYYGLSTLDQGPLGDASVISATQGQIGDLEICGQLGDVLGIGAACGMSRGHGGTGSATVGTLSAALSNVGWPATAGGTLPVTGRATVAGKGDVQLTAVVQAQGGAACVGKGGDKSGNGEGNGTGATSFAVVGSYTMGGPVVDEHPKGS